MNRKTLTYLFFIGSMGFLIFSLVSRYGDKLPFFGNDTPKSRSSTMGLTNIKIKDRALDVGKVPISSEASSEFVLYNLGPGNLFIDKVDVSCTCSTGGVELAAIFPGDSTFITVKTNKKSEGYFYTDVLVYGNFETSPEILSFEGYLVE